MSVPFENRIGHRDKVITFELCESKCMRVNVFLRFWRGEAAWRLAGNSFISSFLCQGHKGCFPYFGECWFCTQEFRTWARQESHRCTGGRASESKLGGY